MQPSGPSLLSSPLASVADAIIPSQSPSILCQCLLQPKYDPRLLLFQNSDFIFGLTNKNNIFCSNIAFGLGSLVEHRGLRDCELNKLSSSSAFVLSQNVLCPIYVLGSVLGTDEPVIPLLSSLLRQAFGLHQGLTFQNPTFTKWQYQSFTYSIAIAVFAHRSRGRKVFDHGLLVF